MIPGRLAKIFVVYFVLISSFSFYTLVYISPSQRDLMVLASIGLIVLIMIIGLMPDPSPGLKKYFRTEIYLFLIATFSSMFVAKAFHNQDFSTTLLVQRFMYFYFFYFALHKLKLDGDDIQNIILPLGILYAMLYIIQYVAYPVRLFDSRIDVSRGTIRIFLPGAGFLMLAYFKSLQDYFTTTKFKYLVFALIIFSVGGILPATRQALASLTLITVAFIFFNRQVKSRLLIVFMAGLAGMAVFVIFYDILIEMITLTREQTDDSRPNIRVMAGRYFLTDFMPSTWAYILGNGQDSLNSTYGQRINIYKLVRGYYQSDVGIIGDYSKFGIFFVIAQLSIMGRIIFGKLHPKISYMRYFMISTALVMFSGGNMFGRVDGIAFVCVFLYLIDYYKNHPETEQENLQQGKAVMSETG